MTSDLTHLWACGKTIFRIGIPTQRKLENVFVKHYAPNHMPDPKGEWSLKENNSELHYGIFWGNIYPFTMFGLPRELIAREKIFFRGRHQNSLTYRHVTKLFLAHLSRRLRGSL